jgi:hypothetical protein
MAPAAHAEPTPQNSDQNPVVRPVFNQPTNIPGKSVEAVTVSRAELTAELTTTRIGVHHGLRDLRSDPQPSRR